MTRPRELSWPAARALIVVVALCWSSMGVAFKFVDWDPLVIAGGRNLMSFLFLALCRRSIRISLRREVVAGALISYFAQTTFTYANKLTTAANAIVLQYTNPIFVLLLSWLLLRQRLRKRDVILTLAMISGIALFFLDELSPGQMTGNLCGLLSGLGMAMGILYACVSRVDLREYAMLNSLIAILIGIPSAIKHPPALSWQPLLAVFFIGVVASGFASNLQAKAAPRLSPVEMSMLLMLDPILNPIWVALMVGEVPDPFALVGMVVVIACVILNILLNNREEMAAKREKALDNIANMV